METIVIVGGGITGCYLAHRLKHSFEKQDRCCKIVVIETTNRVGGRLLSVDDISPLIKKDKGKDKNKKEIKEKSNGIARELGGMRYFFSAHPLVSSLVKELGLKSTIVPYILPTNAAYFKKKHSDINTLWTDSNHLYRKRKKEHNIDLSHLLNEGLAHYVSDIGEDPNSVAALATRQRLFANVNLCNQSFKEVVPNILSKGAFELYREVTGYKTLFEMNLGLPIGLVECLSLQKTSLNAEQYFVVGGYDQIVRSLVKSWKVISTIKQLDQITNGIEIELCLDTHLTKIGVLSTNSNTEKKEKKSFLLHLSNTITKKQYEIVAHRVFLCIPHWALSELEIYDSDSLFPLPSPLSIFSKLLVDLPALKVFLKFPYSWWKEIGYKNDSCGRNLADTALGQIWFYAPCTIMLYTFSNEAFNFIKLLPSHAQSDYVSAKQDGVKSFVNIVIKMLEDVFLSPEPLKPSKGSLKVSSKSLKQLKKWIPEPTHLSWKFWAQAASFWKPLYPGIENSSNLPLTRSKSSSSTLQSIQDFRKKLMHPFDNLFVLNNDISLNQGWIEGALECTDEIINEYIEK